MKELLNVYQSSNTHWVGDGFPVRSVFDYNMPIMDGIDMLRKMREDPGMKRTPVIMLSADSGLQSLTTVARLGVRDYVTKPFREEELLAKAGRIIPLISRTES